MNNPASGEMLSLRKGELLLDRHQDKHLISGGAAGPLDRRGTVGDTARADSQGLAAVSVDQLVCASTLRLQGPVVIGGSVVTPLDDRGTITG